MITVLDLQLGNTGSILNMLRHIGVEATLSADADDIRRARGIILAGVGAFDTATSRLQESGVSHLLKTEHLERPKPVLGICLGMQLLSTGSEEGVTSGLNWIPGRTTRFDPAKTAGTLRVPHMGWNSISPTRPHPLLSGLDDESRFYFVHSYHVVCDDQANVLATTMYGTEFHSIIALGNVFGTQFHPEKSHRFGMTLLSNFAAIACRD